MTRKRNETIGFCTCVICGHEQAEVCVERQSDLKYYNCPNCKCVRMKGQQFQEQINATFRPLAMASSTEAKLPPEPVMPEPVPQPAPGIEVTPEPDPIPEPEPEPTPAKRGGWFGDV